MNSTIRRAGTVVGAAMGVFALTTGSAMAHYCYRTDAPEKANTSKGMAWSTQEEAIQMFAGFLPDGACEDRIVAHIAAMPEGTLFMGPGLLAAGAVRNGNAPEGMGHLFQDAMEFEECAFLFEEE